MKRGRSTQSGLRLAEMVYLNEFNSIGSRDLGIMKDLFEPGGKNESVLIDLYRKLEMEVEIHRSRDYIKESFRVEISD